MPFRKRENKKFEPYELIVPFEVDETDVKKIRRRARSAERREARRRDITVQELRADPEWKTPVDLPIPTTRNVRLAGTKLPLDEYRDKVLAQLALPTHPDPEEVHWLGFSIDELQREAPKPEDAVKLIHQRVFQYEPFVHLEYVAIFRERLLGIGPWVVPSDKRPTAEPPF